MGNLFAVEKPALSGSSSARRLIECPALMSINNVEIALLK